MEEVQQNTSDSFNQEFQEKKKSKKWIFIIVGIIIIVLIFSTVLVRAYAKEYYLNKNSDILRETLLNAINSGNSQIRHLENTNTEDINEIKQTLQENKDYINNQIISFETNNEAKMYDLDKTFICDGETIEYEPGNLPSCSEMNIIEDRGYKEYSVNGTTAIMNIVASSQLITLVEYHIDVLSENKYELEKKLIEIKEGLETEEEITKETDDKIKDIKKNSGSVIAQVLDSLNYLSKKPVIWQTMQTIVRDNENTWDESGGSNIVLIKNIDQDMNFPSENQIQELELKQDCIDLFETSNQYSEAKKSSTPEKLLLLSASISDICENLVKYQKQNAINILKRTETEQNPFVSIENKLYLNLLVNCNNEWFSIERTKPCTENYFKEFETKVSQELNK
jgi:flagellar basal body-associated protein FliL